jgi:hypothetical protein
LKEVSAPSLGVAFAPQTTTKYLNEDEHPSTCLLFTKRRCALRFRLRAEQKRAKAKRYASNWK